MTAEQRMLADCIEIGGRFLRSVNLEKDFPADSQNGEYVVTPTARQILRQVAEGLEERSTSRAWTVTGPYGVGKSSFGVFLTRLLCSDGSTGAAAVRKLEEVDPIRGQEFERIRRRRNGQRLLFPVLITARRVPATVCLLEGILAACSQSKTQAVGRVADRAQSLLRAAKKDGAPDTREVVNCVADLSCAILKRGYAGVLLLIDELGKLFEYAAHRPHKGDMFVLQELAEHASRSGESPVLVVGLLHQSFEEYGRHLDSLSRTEWSKIQGRFQDVAFLEPPEQVVRMIAAAIRWKSGDMPAALKRRLKDCAEQAVAVGVCPHGMKKDEFVDACVRAYPLHPVSLVALPYLFHRFAQNERSLFSYLSSHEPKGFQEFLRGHAPSSASPAFIRLHDLFDYFTANFGSGLFRQPQARRWLEAAEILDRKSDLPDLHSQLVKTVGILSTLGAFCHLGASQDAVSFAAGDSGASPDVSDGLQSLTERSILNYRRFNETYRIWEGSDVDIEERIHEGERRIRTDLRLADAIQQYLPARPVVARRHSFETGALRYFQMRYVDDPAELASQTTIEAGASGLITVCLSSSGAQLEEFKKSVAGASAANPSMLIAIPQEIGELRAMVAELAALQWAWENTPELRDDRVARRELASRLADTQQLLTKSLSRLLDPRDEPVGSECCWYSMGERKKVRNPAQVSHLLSEVCDELYAQCPRIHNELIARKALSSAAAAARRNLLERMLTAADQENLGLEGYPPERSMYESVLKATGLHRRHSQGGWRFAAPTATDPCRLRPVWQKLYELVFQPRPTPLAVTALSHAIAEPPHGVPDGLHPVILCAFLDVYSTEVTLYREGTFLPEPGITDFEVLVRRPEFFAIAGCRLVGGRATVVERIAKGLAVDPATVPVVRALFRMVKGLPEFARSTTKLSAPTQAMRQAFLNARSPDRFLFTELPEALGIAPFEEGRPAHRHIDEFFAALNGALQEWSSALPSAVNTARDVLLQACGFPPGLQGWSGLRERACELEPSLTHPTLLPFVRRIAQSSDDQSAVESVLALVANRPPHIWTDTDVDRFPAVAEGVGLLLRQAVAALRFQPADRSDDGLAPSERKRAEKIAREIEDYLRNHNGRLQPKIVRAVCAILSERAEKEGPQEGTP